MTLVFGTKILGVENSNALNCEVVLGGGGGLVRGGRWGSNLILVG
jgi:hypothetical protein